MDRDNPQETQELTPAEAGWLAGMIEGDGYITLMFYRAAKKKSNGGFVVAPKIGVTNLDAGIIEKARDLFRRCGAAGVYITEKELSGSWSKKDSILDISTTRISSCFRILVEILPHLAGSKAAKARLILDYLSSRLTKPYKTSPYDLAEIEIIKTFIAANVDAKGRPRNKALLKSLNDYTPDSLRSEKI